MEWIISSIIDFIRKATPSWKEIVYFAPLLTIYVFLAKGLVSYLRIKKHIHYAYTRKIFHFAIFIFAGILQILFGLTKVIIFGLIVSIFVLYAVYKGKNSGHFKAMARDSDHPREKTFVIIPLITTALGGVLANIFFGHWASIGYLISGAGDAIGEPVGAWRGYHTYKVPSIAGVPAQRSLEGSAAIFIASTSVGILGFLMQGLMGNNIIIFGFICGLAGTITEAISNHGLDNLSIQLVVSGVAYFLIQENAIY